MSILRVLIADDERPARNFLKGILESFEDIRIIAEAENGEEALDMIRETLPDLALLDLQMPILTGIEVVKSLRKNQMPLIGFITAFDEYAINAFELNAIDYLLKPVDRSRLGETLRRAAERLEQADFREIEASRIKGAINSYEEMANPAVLERIPIKQKEGIFLLPVNELASITADGELLYLTNFQNKKFVINYRLKDLEARIDPNKFIRLSRSMIVNLEMIARINPLPGGVYQVNLKNGQEMVSSRLQSRILREKLLKL